MFPAGKKRLKVETHVYLEHGYSTCSCSTHKNYISFTENIIFEVRSKNTIIDLVHAVLFRLLIFVSTLEGKNGCVRF